MTKFHLWADVMLRQPRVWVPRASPAQKWQGIVGGFIPKTFQGLHFLFSWALGWLIYF